jgi:TonB family protein
VQTTLTSATAALCFAEADERLAGAAVTTPAERRAAMERAVEQFRSAADATRVPAERLTAVEGLVRMFDADHLGRPRDQESVLRELIGLVPNDLAPMFRLAELQEAQDFIDAAEDTFQDARRRQPGNLEPYRRLAQFYARRAQAVQPTHVAPDANIGPSGDPTPDARGVFRVGGPVTAPRRDGVAQVPEAARLLGVEGAVRVEIVVDETGAVSEVTVLRSIPLLDEEAVRAVKQWRFAPTMVGGQAVPVRMEAVVNFSLR